MKNETTTSNQFKSLEIMSSIETKQDKRRSRNNRRRILRKHFLSSLGTAFNKVNPAKWIHDLEQQQELAYKLEEVNEENKQEEKRKALVRESQAKCLQDLQTHLSLFLQKEPFASYEDWVKELHPDNINGLIIDHRLYLEEDEHRMLWNQNLTDKDTGEEIRAFVPAMKNED